jgi:hypothetical protein
LRPTAADKAGEEKRKTGKEENRETETGSTKAFWPAKNAKRRERGKEKMKLGKEEN